MASENYLIISDTQEPFGHSRAIEFCQYLQKYFRVLPENVLHVGDEVDNLHGGMYPKDPDGLHTPKGEIKAAQERMALWAQAFPLMKIAISNHGMRWVKKAAAAEIPSQMIRAYQEVLQLPPGWVWQDSWIIKGSRKPFMIKHGLDCSGKTPYRGAAEIGAMSVAFGHLHSTAGLCHVKTKDKNLWAMNVGCLIDADAYAFKYEKENKFKPNLGCGIVLDGGRIPLWIPLE